MQKRITTPDPGNGFYTPGKPRRMKDGWNLNDVFRDIVTAIQDDRGWSGMELARQLDYSPSTVNRFLAGDDDDDRGVRLEFVSRLCARMGETPVELFARHPLYAPTGSASEKLIRERVASALFVHEARAFLPLLEELKFRGLIDVALNQLELAVETAKRSGPSVTRPRKTT